MGGAREDELPECVRCGACCFSQLAEYVRVLGDDYERLGERAADWTHFSGNRCFMRMEGGRCAALVVEADTGRFVCSVYDARPATCRDLERGSGACLGEIHTKGDRPGALALSLVRGRGR